MARSIGMLCAVLAGLAVAGAAAGVAAQDGRAIYHGKGNCFTCHGRDGAGTPLGPVLRDTVWLNVDGSRAAILQVIREGVAKPKQYPAPMPAMGGAKLSPAELEAVATYVHGLSRAALAGEAAELKTPAAGPAPQRPRQ
ncbi:MAG TPA: c-type cytochrome [Longimicrobiales bacterium]|nr:c-type cytochrome [Longimicrobiales bacterium]